MQVTETLSEGLKREYKVVVPAAELVDRISAEMPLEPLDPVLERRLDAELDRYEA